MESVQCLLKELAGRPYKTIDDLLKVKGIGSKKLEKIRPYAVVNKE